LSVLILGLASSAAFAQFPGGGPGNRTYPRLNVINNCDGAVVVTLNGREWTTLEPAQSFTVQYIVSSEKGIDVTVGATLVGTSISDTETTTLIAGKTTTATITCPTSTSLAITFSLNGKKRASGQ
jgi:hypothetical protein